MQEQFLITVLLLGVMACNKTKVNDDKGDLSGSGSKTEGQKDKSIDQGPAQQAAAEEDKFDPPASITGSYLQCAQEVSPTAEKVEALLGCRVNDERGQRKSLSAGAYEYGYIPGSLTSTAFKVYRKDIAADNRYDVAYLFQSDSAKNLVESMNGTQITLALKDTNGATLSTLANLLPEIQVDANTLSPPRTTDYDAIRTEMAIAGATESEPTPPIP